MSLKETLGAIQMPSKYISLLDRHRWTGSQQFQLELARMTVDEDLQEFKYLPVPQLPQEYKAYEEITDHESRAEFLAKRPGFINGNTDVINRFNANRQENRAKIQFLLECRETLVGDAQRRNRIDAHLVRVFRFKPEDLL